MKIVTNSYTQTQELGEDFAKKLYGGDVLLLFGELGSGKTTFMQGLAKGLGIQRRIISPTFIIVRRYVIPAKAGYSPLHGGIQEKEWIPDHSIQYLLPRSGAVRDDSSHGVRTIKTLYHIDLYRTQTEDDLKGLGLPEILEEKNAIIAIEWPEKLGSFLPAKRWELHFKTMSENERSITIEEIEK